MNPFEKMMGVIFSNKDFLQKCYIENVEYDCIISSVNEDMVFAEAGLEAGASFTIDLKLPISPMPKINDKVIYRDKEYKISNIESDSANTSLKLSLIALSKQIGG